MQELSVLYHKGKAGLIYSWKVWVEGPVIVTEYGLMDGKKQVARKEATPKNVGKKNQTTAAEQAQVEAQALWQHRLDHKYSTTPEEAGDPLFLPMLAHDFDKKGGRLAYPVSVQPKLDGLRCLAKREGGEVILLSRQGKRFRLPRIEEALSSLPEGVVLDGELYIHELPGFVPYLDSLEEGEGRLLTWRDVRFNKISSWVKKSQPETAAVQYHVYDCPAFMGEDSYPWDVRIQNLRDLFRSQGYSRTVCLVETRRAVNAEEVRLQQAEFMREGYEGAIVRSPGGVYHWGHRSDSLLKVKSWRDAEFTIVGHTDGGGKDAGTVIWECRVGADSPTAKTFQVRPMGTHEERAQLFLEARKHHGARLKVKFFEMTPDGVPRFPIGLGIRLEED